MTPDEFMQADFLQMERCAVGLDKCGECAVCIMARAGVRSPFLRRINDDEP